MTSPTSIAACTAAVSNLTGGTLDILINNAGATFISPLADVDLAAARACFDINFFGYIATTQAFLPLLLAASQSSRSGYNSIIANHSSMAATSPAPWQGIYSASKAAVVTMTDVLRFEMAPLGIQVVEIKSGVVASGIYGEGKKKKALPENSVYEFARGEIEMAMQDYDAAAVPAEGWARDVVGELLRRKPKREVSFGGLTLMNGILGSAG